MKPPIFVMPLPSKPVSASVEFPPDATGAEVGVGVGVGVGVDTGASVKISCASEP